MENKRDDAVMEWLKKHRRDVAPTIESILKHPQHDPGLYALICIAFEAGRQFQADNPTLELDNPNVY